MDAKTIRTPKHNNILVKPKNKTTNNQWSSILDTKAKVYKLIMFIRTWYNSLIVPACHYRRASFWSGLETLHFQTYQC